MGYTHVTIRGIGWMGLLQVSVRIISFIKIILVAKILSPVDIGVFVIVTTVLSLVEVFSEIGVQTFLVQSKQALSRVIGTAWVVIFLRGVLLFFVILAFSYPVAMFFNNPSLFPLVALSSLIPLIKACENPFVVTFQKHLHFRIEFTYRLFIVLTDFFVSLYLVSIFHSVFGLLVGLIASICLGVILSWILLRERPSLRIEKKVFYKLTTFTKAIIPLNIANYLVNQIDAILIGKLSGVGALGVYQIGQKFSSQPLIEISDIFGKVTLPVYVKITNDRQRLLRAYKKIVVFLSAVSILVALLLFLLSPLLIRFLGPAWQEANALFPILLTYGFVMAIWGTNGSLYFSLGAQKLLAKLAVIRLIITVPLLGIAIYYFNIIGAAWALLISMIVIQPITFYYTLSLFSGKKMKGKKKKSV